MKIISIRNGFQSDHSSSNYEFFSSERALTENERSSVAKYSRRSQPGTRKATFQYNGDWNDLPSGAEDDLLTNYFDILVSESYDSWHFAIAFDYDNQLLKNLKKYECEGPDDAGLVIERKNTRIILHLHCQIRDADFSSRPFATGIAEEEDDESEVEVDFKNFRNLLITLKREIGKGTFSSLSAVVNFYEPGKVSGAEPYTKVGETLRSVLSGPEDD